MRIPGFLSILAKHGDLMDRMLQKLHIKTDFEQLPNQAAVHRRAVSRCMTCRHADACAEFLSSPESSAHAPTYCRNVDLFDRIIRQQELHADA